MKEKEHNSYIGSLIHGITSLLTGMKTTMTVFWRKKTTEQYPENRKAFSFSLFFFPAHVPPGPSECWIWITFPVFIYSICTHVSPPPLLSDNLCRFPFPLQKYNFHLSVHKLAAFLWSLLSLSSSLGVRPWQ